MNWEELLRAEIRRKGRAAVCLELGIAASTLSLLLSGKYPGRTDRIAARVERTYGADNTVRCPILGQITVAECRQHSRAARRYGKRATGNPATLRLYVTCPKCENRSV